MRAAEGHRHAEALHRARRHVRAPFGRGLQQNQRQRIGGGDDQRAIFLCVFNGFGMVVIDAMRVGPRHDHCGGVFVDVLAVNGQAHRLGAGVEHIDGLRMQRAENDDAAALAFVVAHGESGGFGDGGGLVEQARRRRRQGR